MRLLLPVGIVCVLLLHPALQPVTAQVTDWADCSACHETAGDTLPPISTFRPTNIAMQQVECLDCHLRSELSRVGGSWSHPVRPVGAHIACTMCHPAVAHGQRADPPLPTGDYNHEGCFACHRSIEAKLAVSSGHRGVVECRECHPPHTQLDAALPASLIPSDAQASIGNSYDWYGSNELCLSCHGPAQLMMQLSSGFVTLNTENYHDIHVVRGNVMCVECHDPHGSIYSPMVRSELPTGEIMLYLDEPDGGTCAVLCHGVDHTGWRYVNRVR